MADDGLRERLHTESKVLRDAGWSGPAATMLDASQKLSQMNNLLAEILPFLNGNPALGRKVYATLMNRDPAVVTPFDDDEHPVVGCFYEARDDHKAYFCDSFDPKAGYWMTPIDPLDIHSAPKPRRLVAEGDLDGAFRFTGYCTLHRSTNPSRTP